MAMTANMVDNILTTFDAATDDEFNTGMYWYNGANALCWQLDHLNYRRAAGIIAALSPMMPWERNVELTRLVYSGATYIPCLQNNATKALAILKGWNPLDILSGVKVTNFYNNIINPYGGDFVTIDTHAACIAMADPTYAFQSSKGRYALFADAYREAADIVDLFPSQLQAITWTHWRNNHAYTKKAR